jgi:hypothetical protein
VLHIAHVPYPQPSHSIPPHPLSHLRFNMMLPDPLAAPPSLQLPPAASDGDAPDAMEIKPAPSSTVNVRVVSLQGASVDMTFQRHTCLRAMQKQLCAAFGKNFPYSTAAVCVGNEAFSDFEDIPLRLAEDHQTVSVIFQRQISDPYGYDEIGRKRGNKITLEQECTWEALAASGETTLGLEEWAFSSKRPGS